MKTALLLMAHGSRQEEANADLYHVAAAMRTRGSFVRIEPAFLELAAPSIEEGAARCVASGAEQIVMVPYFLSSGVHVRRDLAGLREQLAQRYPRVAFHL